MENRPATDSSIQLFFNPRRAECIRPIPKLFSFLVMGIGVLTLFGWLFDITVLKSILPGFVSMKPNTAVSLILSATSVLLISSPENENPKYQLSRIIGALVVLVSGLTLFEYFAGLNLGIDTLLFSEPAGAVGTLASGRMEPITAINLFLLGMALYLNGPQDLRRHPLSHVLAFPVAAIAFFPLVGYLYGTRFLIGIGTFSSMAPHTALCFILLSIAILVARPDHDLAAVLLSDGPGGAIARRILPAAILIPLLFGWFRVLGERFGFFSAEFGTALFTTANIVGFACLIWVQSVALQRNELKRRITQRERDILSLQSEMRDQFVAMLSHDLRNPLTAATTCAQLIRRYPGSDEFTRAKAERIIESLSRNERMIQDLLDVNQIRAGHPLQLRLAECDLATIVEATIHELTVIHGSRFVFEGEHEVTGKWDPTAIRRAVDNLCSNAVKYGDPESPIIVRVEHFKTQIRVSVHNWGKDISPEEQKSLFEPFQRVGPLTDKAKKGWGLGLALVKGIAEAHGGQVFLESSVEHGTRFTIELPESIKDPIERNDALGTILL